MNALSICIHGPFVYGSNVNLFILALMSCNSDVNVGLDALKYIHVYLQYVCIGELLFALLHSITVCVIATKTLNVSVFNLLETTHHHHYRWER